MERLHLVETASRIRNVNTFIFNLVKCTLLQVNSGSRSRNSRRWISRISYGISLNSKLTYCIFSMIWFYKIPGVSTFQEYLQNWIFSTCFALFFKVRIWWAACFSHYYLHSESTQMLLACCLGVFLPLPPVHLPFSHFLLGAINIRGFRPPTPNRAEITLSTLTVLTFWTLDWAFSAQWLPHENLPAYTPSLPDPFSWAELYSLFSLSLGKEL